MRRPASIDEQARQATTSPLFAFFKRAEGRAGRSSEVRFEIVLAE
jgi:hypothetical protein